MEPDKRTPEQRGDDRAKLMDKVQSFLQVHDPEPDDVAWVCAMLAGHAAALCAEEDPQRFADNMKLTVEIVHEQGERTFGGDCSDWHMEMASERTCDAPLA